MHGPKAKNVQSDDATAAVRELAVVRCTVVFSSCYYAHFLKEMDAIKHCHRTIFFRNLLVILASIAIAFTVGLRTGQGKVRTVAPLVQGRRPCTSNPLVLVYNRIPKAGSTSLMALAKELSVKNGFSMVTPEPYFAHEKIRRAIFHAIVTNTRTLVVNHFHFPEIIYSDRVEYMNMVRDPVSRLLSDYSYLRSFQSRKNHALSYREKHGDISVDECMFGNTEFSGKCLPISNLQAHFFCGMERSACHANATLLASRAASNMEKIYTIGVTERYDDTLKMLETKYPRFFRGISELYSSKQEKTLNTNQHTIPSDRAIEALKKDNAVDYDLYKRADLALDQYIMHCLHD